MRHPPRPLRGSRRAVGRGAHRVERPAAVVQHRLLARQRDRQRQPAYLMGLGNGGGFTYYDADLNLINNDQFGTCTVESLDPLTVTYRINEGVTWSDGTQIDAADLILYWGAVSTIFNVRRGGHRSRRHHGRSRRRRAADRAGPDGHRGARRRGSLHRRGRPAGGLDLQGVHRRDVRRGQRVARARDAVPRDLRRRSRRHDHVGQLLRRLPAGRPDRRRPGPRGRPRTRSASRTRPRPSRR